MPQHPSSHSNAFPDHLGVGAADSWPYSEELGNLQSELQAYVAAVSGDPSSAADIVQEANMVIWEKRESFHQEKEGDFRAWAFRIAYFKALAHRRDKSRQGWLVFSDEVVQQIASKADTLVKGQNLKMDALQLCLAKIKPEQRTLLSRIYGAGNTIPEYAAENNVSRSATYKTLQRLRSNLRKCINRALTPSS